MAVQRSIIVDDTSPLIQYQGVWFSDTSGSQDAIGNYGPVFNKSLHGTVSESASFSFAYTGTQINVVGTIDLRNDTGTPDPQWECTVDGTLLPNNPSTDPNNNWYLCNTGSTPVVNEDGPHTLTVTITVRQNQTFWLDRLVYTPSPNAPLDDETTVVENYDPALQYGSGWGVLDDNANFTSEAGSTLSFSFVGVSLSWFGYIESEKPQSSATFSVDGNTPTSFTINPIPPSENVPTLFNQQMFTTPVFPFGSHTLDVVFLGNANTTSLVLDYLIVQNGKASEPVEATSTAANGQIVTFTETSQTMETIPPIAVHTTPSANSEGSRHHIPLGPVIGSAMGALVIILAVVLVFYARRLRSRRGMPLQYTHPPISGSNPYPSSAAGISSNVAPKFLPSSKAAQHRYRTSFPGDEFGTLSTNPSTSSSSLVAQHSLSSSQNLSHGRVVVHQDSGMRNWRPSLLRTPVEVPPQYTAT